MMRMMRSIVEGVVAIIGAFTIGQLPMFMQQYIQRLGGHVQELSTLLDKLRENAGVSNKSLPEYIHKFLNQTDHDFILQGEFMNGVLDRWEELKALLDQLTQSSLWERPFIFFKGLQSSIFYSTIDAFEPGINLTVEGLAYAAIGMVTALGIYHLILSIFKTMILIATQTSSENLENIPDITQG